MDEMTTTQATESTATESASTEPASQAATESATPETTQATTPAQEAPQYQPNFKFKSYDKEAEFDEFVRPLVKDKDTEEKLRDLYTKAYGLEPMKQKYTKLQEEHAPLKTKYDTLYGNVNRLGQFLEKGDLDNFFQGVGVKEDQIYKWALHKLQMQEMPPEQRQAYQELSERRRNETLMAEQYALTQAELQKLQTQQRMFELDQNLSRQDLKPMIDAYESKVGQPGAFRQEVIRHAQLVFKESGQDLSATDAINQVLERYKPFLQMQASNPMGQPSPQVQSQSRAPVIPNVTGRSTSPAAKQVRSLDDIIKLSKEMD